MTGAPNDDRPLRHASAEGSVSMTTHVLFICRQGRMRSRTAAELFGRHPRLETDCAGLDRYADRPLTAEQLDWADVVLVMEEGQRRFLLRRFADRLQGKRLRALGIPDQYDYMDPDLLRLLAHRVPPALGPV